jgi:hypothetical protein
MNLANSPEAFPPLWTQKGWVKPLVEVNLTKKSLGPTALGHALIFLGISFGAIVLYVVTLLVITFLSRQWRICPGS